MFSLRDLSDVCDANDRVQAGIEINYDLDSWEGIVDLGSDALENALQNENVETEGCKFIPVKSNGFIDPAYENFISAPQGCIICVNNSNLEDHKAPESRLEWSDVVFQVYQMEATKTLQELRRLRIIWQFWIMNPVMQSIGWMDG